MSVLTRYAEVLRVDGARTALGVSLIGRVSLGMTGLAILLLVRSGTGSYASAGLVSGAYALAFALGAPARARSADKNGPVRVLVACGLAHPLALATLVTLATLHAPVVEQAAAAVAAGLTLPPLGAVMRALWGELTDGAARATAYSLESVAVEACFVLGPGLTAALVALSGPAAALAASALTTLIGGVGLSRTPAIRLVRPHPTAVRSLAGPLASGTVRALLLTGVWVGIGFGGLEVAMPAFVEASGGKPGGAGVLLAIWSLGSMAGGLLYGASTPTRSAARQLPLLVGALAVGSALPLLAHGNVTMAGALTIYGMTIAPFFACSAVLLGAAAPAGTTTEAFAWLSSVIFGGAAAGTAVAGALVDAVGAGAGLAVTAAAGAMTLATALTGVRLVSAS